jgi:ABC-2 type transport system permease protein
MDWGQLRTIVWLRGRLIRNQWSRAGKFNAVLTIIAVWAGCVVAVAGGIGGVLLGAFVLAKAQPTIMLIAWDMIVAAFLFFWMIGLIGELQRSETIDIGRMMHLPVSLKDIFLVNYVASHLTLSIILFLPAMLGLCLGLILGGRWLMVLMFPLVLGVVFMVTAWTHCLRGWLAALMVNKRRRRAIIAGVTFGFILLVQIPNLFNIAMRDRHRRRPREPESVVAEKPTAEQSADRDKIHLSPMILMAHKCVPFLWVGNGARAIAGGNVWPAVLGAAGAFGIGGLGLRRAHRTTLGFYRGQATSVKPARKAKATRVAAEKRGLFDRSLPGVPDEAMALGSVFFRSLVRAPEIKMAMASNFLMLLFFGAMFLVRRSSPLGDQFKPFAATGAVFFTFFGLSQLMFNQFGFDRGGFRQLVLLPVRRKWILLGKNLAFLPVALGMGLIALTIVTLAMRITPVVFLAACFQLIAAFLLVSMAANLLSVLLPHHVAQGSLKQTKTSSTTTLLIFVTRLLFMPVMAVLFIPPGVGLLMSRVGWLPAAPVHLLCSAVLAGLLALSYKLSLIPLGDLLQRRERQILKVVTKEVE